jgi:hypothetical protein
MSIGFDLDKIFINTPPLVPPEIIDLFNNDETSHELRYKIPSKKEQIIRIFSHHSLFRFPIIQNLNFLKKSFSTYKNLLIFNKLYADSCLNH